MGHLVLARALVADFLDAALLHEGKHLLSEDRAERGSVCARQVVSREISANYVLAVHTLELANRHISDQLKGDALCL